MMNPFGILGLRAAQLMQSLRRAATPKPPRELIRELLDRAILAGVDTRNKLDLQKYVRDHVIVKRSPIIGAPKKWQLNTK